MSNNIEEQDFTNEKIDYSLWKRICKYALHYKGLVAALIGVLVVVAAIDLVYPLLSQYAIDNFIEAGKLDNLTLYIIIYAAFVVIQGTMVALFVTFGGKLEMYISYDIRQEAFKKLQELSFSYYDKTPVGYLMARMVSDVSRLSEMIAWSIVDVFWAVMYLIGVLIIMFTMNAKLAGLILIVIPPLVLLCRFFQQRILKRQREVRKTNSKITGSFNEGIMGAVTTKTLVREERNAEEFKELTHHMRHSSVRSAMLSYVFLPLTMLLGSVATAIALYFGGVDVIFEVISVGTLAAFISYASAFFDPIQNIANIFTEMQSAQASAERVIALIDTPCDIVDSPEVIAKYGDCFDPKRENFEPIKGNIEFSHVDFAYKNGEKVLTDFNLKVNAGETIALVGETGAGKSTIVNLVCRFYEPTGGSILIDGVDYRERSQSWLQSSLGYVLQQPHLFSGTIRDNIRYGRKDATDEEVVKAAKLVHAHQFISELERGYNAEVGEGGTLLSTGQKQLVSFARVILSNPSIFVLDEATSSIDTETEQLIQEAITHVLKGRTSFIVAHRLSTIRNADRILVIRNGKITENGTHLELLRLRGYYYELYTNQFKDEATRATL